MTIRKTIINTVLPVLLAVASLCSCDKAEETYGSNYPCAFSFDTRLHPTSLLTRVMDNPGSFVRVDVRKTQGINRLSISSNNGIDTEDLPITTDRENYRIGNVGAANSIIVGCSVFNGPCAYDSQCPNCIVTGDISGVSILLAWTRGGQAVTCGKCKRSYELNYDGRPTETVGRPLMRYKIGYNGVEMTVYN